MRCGAPAGTTASIFPPTAAGSSATRPTTSPAPGPSAPRSLAVATGGSDSTALAVHSPDAVLENLSDTAAFWRVARRVGRTRVFVCGAGKAANHPLQPHPHSMPRSFTIAIGSGPRRVQVQGAPQGGPSRRRPQHPRHGNRFRGALRFSGLHPARGRGRGPRRIREGHRPWGFRQRRGDRRQPGARGVRCGVCWSEQLAIWNRAHNDGNCLSIGQRTVTEAEAIGIVRTWLTTEFEGGRHIARIRKIDGA